jgi:ribonuclease Z
MQLAKYKIKRSKISHVFISHLHGDHYFGLIGLLTSMGLLNRTADLHVHGPALLKDILDIQLNAANIVLPYPLHFHPLGEDSLIANDKKITVECFKVKHRIECWGFLFREKRNPRHIDPDKVRSYEIPSSFYDALQKGQDYVNKKGTIIPNAEVTVPGTTPKSYAYCADTLYDESMAEKVKGVDLLYHETTYLKNFEEKAIERFHSTTEHAANIAVRSGAKKLIIGHFSSKYEDLDEFLQETSLIFPQTELALEGLCFPI